MPLPGWLGRLNRRLTNRLLRPVAGRVPIFGVVIHRGHRSGRLYRTPVNVFSDPDGFVIALTYGSRAEWVQNVLAAGGCAILHRGRRIELVAPRLVRAARPPAAIPAPVRPILRLLRVTEFLLLQPVEA